MFLRTIFRPTVTSQKEVNRYVATVTVFALVCFLAIDIPNHFLFFTRWSDYLRDWSIDVVASVVVAVPVLRSIGCAHLELYFAKREAERLSRTDALTGLANRRAFYDAAGQISDARVTLAIADIDRFKRVNDRYGHAVGDAVIQLVAKVLSDELADLGAVARVGGEEFAIVGGEVAYAEIRARLERVRERLAKTPTLVDDQPVFASISFGLATGAGANFGALYASADKALYVAKASGRDRVVDFDDISDIAEPANSRELSSGERQASGWRAADNLASHEPAAPKTCAGQGRACGATAASR